MSDKMKFKENLSCNVSRLREIFEKVPMRGHWKSEIWRLNPKTGLLEYEKTIEHDNDIPTAAKNKLWDTMFNAATQTAANSWFGGLINATGFTGYNAADTLASHGGWTEFTSYSGGARPAWGQGAAASSAITNATPMVFNITGSGTVQGLFICTASSGTSGLLWSASSYTTPTAVSNGDQIRSTYSLSC